MNLKRFEILLPLNYNDGRPIERKKFLVTHREILDHFGATTIDAIQAFGTWKYLGTLYADRLIRIRIDSTEPDEAYYFLQKSKDVLKARFEQVDIWITAHDVEVV